MESHLAMAVLTTERVTAFMPALSPPEVRTAIFILGFCGRLVVDAMIRYQSHRRRVMTRGE